MPRSPELQSFLDLEFSEIAVLFDLNSVLTSENCERQWMDIILSSDAEQLDGVRS